MLLFILPISLAAQVNVSGSTGADGSYATLHDAFGAINANPDQAGKTITVSITGNTTESASATLNQPAINSWVALTIIPSGGAALIITGNIAAPLINLNGVQNVIIDGLNDGVNSLTIRNTSTASTAGTSTIRFINDASNNIIRNTVIEGSGTSATSGTILFSTGMVTGNDNNTITNSVIKPAGAYLPTNAVYSAGTSALVDNSHNLITNNHIQDFFNPGAASNGIFAGSFNSAWTISGNRFFQTSTRTASTNNTHRAIQINSSTGSGFTVSNNIIGFANASGTGVTNYDGAVASLFRAIELTVGTALASSVHGNTISGIAFSTTSAATALPGIFSGISVLGGAVNIGNMVPNSIGAATGDGSIHITSSTTGGVITGIYATSTATVQIQNNIIGSISTGGGSGIGYTFHAIYTAGALGNMIISGNQIGSSATAHSIAIGTSEVTTTGVCSFNGITNAATGIITISGNSIINVSAFGTAASVLNGILNSGGTGALNITGNNLVSATNTGTGATIGISNSAGGNTTHITANTLSNNTTATGAFTGIVNSGAAVSLALSNNTISSHSATSGAFTGISNTGSVVSEVTINNNQLGNADGGLVSFSAANAGTLTGISNATGTMSGIALTISTNDFRGITHSVAGSSAHTYILNSAATLSQNISHNTFTNLNVNTTGNVIFISSSVALQPTGSQTIHNNRIEGSFSKTGAGGTITIFNSAAVSPPGATIVHTNNIFSGITATGATVIAGWVFNGAGLATQTISQNTFSNWTTGAAAITGLNINGFGGNSSITDNNISHFSGQAAITGMTTGSAGNAGLLTITNNTLHNLTSTGPTGNVIAVSSANVSPLVNIHQNTIHTLVSSGGTTTVVTGIAITAGTVKNIYQNTIHNLQGTGLTTGSVNGINVTGGTNIHVSQNTIHTLEANALTTGTLNGIAVSVGGVVNLSRNKIHNLSSASADLTTGAVNGILVSGTAVSMVTNISNNIVGDLRVTAASGTNIIRGVAITSTGTSSDINLYHNTIFLSAPATTGANLGTSGVFHTASVTATTALLNMRNNIIVNVSEFKGTGTTAAFRRSAGAAGRLANYAPGSNNNLFFAGIPGPGRLIYSDGTSSAQTMATYKAGVFTAGTITPRDAGSVTENPNWVSTLGNDANFLKIDPSVATQIESGGENVAGITVDFDGNIRQGNTGYSGSGFAPDIGAFEFAGILPDITWDGEAGTNNWSDALNWVFDLTPTPYHTVLLNGPYTIDANVNVSVRNMVIDNDDLLLTITHNRLLTINNNLHINRGRLDTREAFPTVNGQIIITGGTIGYTSETQAQTVSVQPYFNLAITSQFGAFAEGDLTVSGELHLGSNPVSLSTLGSLNMGQHTLTMGATAITTGTGDVTGRIRRTSFIPELQYTFGSQFTTLGFSANGTLPTEVIFNITIGEAPAWSSQAVKRMYDIFRTGGSGATATIALRYLESELNQNAETALNINTHDVGTALTTNIGKSSGNYTQNFIVRTDLPISNLATGINQRFWILLADNSVVISGVKGWRMIASPAFSTYSDLLSGLVTQGFPGSVFPARQPNLLWFNETDGRTTNMAWRTVSSLSAHITPGRGYYFYVFGEVQGDPDYTTPLPISISVNGLTNFTHGTFQFSGLNHPVTFTPRSSGQVGGGAFIETNINDQGWNMLGNPTMHTLDWNAATGWTKTNIDNTIYIWDVNANEWKFWNGVVGNHNGLIPPFQGFWVRANDHNPEVSFTEQAFSHIYGTFKQQDVKHQVVSIPITLSDGNLQASSYISFSNQGIIGRDPMDAYRLEPLSNTWLELFTLSSPVHKDPLVVNNLPFFSQKSYHIPVFARGNNTGINHSGSMELHWEIPTNWPQDWSITLHDHIKKQAISMTSSNRYRFSLAPNLKSIQEQSDYFLIPVNIVKQVDETSMLKNAQPTPTFSIVVSKSQNNNYPDYIAMKPQLLPVNPNPISTTVYIRFTLPEEARAVIRVYDTRGIRVAQLANETFASGMHEIVWNHSLSAPGVYIIRLITNDATDAQKILFMK